MDNNDVKILEAILFASGEPIHENDLKEIINFIRKTACHV